MQSDLAYDTLADKNFIEVCGEMVSFPITTGTGAQAQDINVDEYIQLAWKAVLDTAVSYNLTGEARYNYYFFANTQQKFKNQFYSTFKIDTSAADAAFKFFETATSNTDTTSHSRRRMKGSPSSSHLHVILKAIVFLTKVMKTTEGKDEFYPMVILDVYNNPIPVMEKNGEWVKLIRVNGATVEQALTTEDHARKTHTFIAFSQLFAQLIKQNRVQEFGSWTGLPSRLYALAEMIKVRLIQYKRTVQISDRLEKKLKYEKSSASNLAQRQTEMMEQSTQLNKDNIELRRQIQDQKDEVVLLEKQIEKLQSKNETLQGGISQGASLAQQQLQQKETAYTQALKAKDQNIKLLVEEVRKNRERIAELESKVETSQHSPTRSNASLTSPGQKSQIAFVQQANKQLTARIADQDSVIAEQTKKISELTAGLEGLERQNEKLEAEKGVLLGALQSFFEFMMSWFRVAPVELKDCLQVEGVPGAKEGTTFADAFEPKIREVSSLLGTQGIVTSFGKMQQQRRDAEGPGLFQGMEYK